MHQASFPPPPQDPRCPGDRVILVHSLVEGGAAERDGQLKVGDKLLAVNRVSVLNHSLQVSQPPPLVLRWGGVGGGAVYALCCGRNNGLSIQVL